VSAEATSLTTRGLAVRIGSRSGRPPFDWNADPSTWVPLLRGVTAAYLTYYPDLAFPGAADSIRTFARLAEEAGVRRLVLLSGRGRNAHVTDDVKRVTGREARRFADFVHATAATGVWNA
jgi:hypothetical protein